jgi:hypothetical protein
MNRLSLRILVLVGLLLLLLGGGLIHRPALAESVDQALQGLRLAAWTFSNGGLASGGSYTAHTALGEWAGGPAMTGGTYTVDGGLLPGGADPEPPPPPPEPDGQVFLPFLARE